MLSRVQWTGKEKVATWIRRYTGEESFPMEIEMRDDIESMYYHADLVESWVSFRSRIVVLLVLAVVMRIISQAGKRSDKQESLWIL